MNTPLPNRFSLNGRVVLLTGAAGHLGRVIAQGLCEAGAHVLLNGKTPGSIEALAVRLQDHGLKATSLPFDIRDESLVQCNIKKIEDSWGRLDVIINNASLGYKALIESDTTTNFQMAYETAVTKPFYLIQQAIPLLEKTAQETPYGASVINISSMYGIVSPDPSIYGTSGQNSPPHYGPSKAALLQLTRYLACHLGEKRIRVNAISPGPFPRAELMKEDPDLYKALCLKTPLRRVGQPEELLGVVLFLASDASSYMTGANIPIDGGWTAW